MKLDNKKSRLHRVQQRFGELACKEALHTADRRDQMLLKRYAELRRIMLGTDGTPEGWAIRTYATWRMMKKMRRLERESKGLRVSPDPNPWDWKTQPP